MKKKKVNLVLLSIFSVCTLWGQQVKSPNGDVVVDLANENGSVFYSIQYKGKSFLEKSPLGVYTDLGNFNSNLKPTSLENEPVKNSYFSNRGKFSRIDVDANQLRRSYLTADGDTLKIIFHVSNNDIAFCYQLSSPKKNFLSITGEATGFRLPAKSTTYISPQSKAGTFWMETKPSYEEEYTNNLPLNVSSTYGEGYTFPALFRMGADGWLLLSETGVTGRYVGTHLSEYLPEGLYQIAFPMSGENRGVGDTSAHVSLPATTSWKTITLGESLAPIVESTIATDVVRPQYAPKYDYLPGTASWSWILWGDESMNWNDQISFIDMIAEAGLKYILIDALWDTQVGYERMPDLIKYAHSKGVECLLWYNSNGYWNNAPQGPKQKLNTPAARQKEFAWLQSLGIKGLKVDFFGGDKQATMQLYEDILVDANNYGLAIVFHGCTLPRGWERIYPNYISSEAVLASENLVFQQHHADLAAWNSTVIPFTRGAVAAMDYGPVFLSPRYSKQDDKGTIRRTTDTYELASSILYYAPIQHFGLVPNDLKRQPRYMIDFLRDVPTTWDETRYIGGEPSTYCAIARRKGERWYVAASNGTKERLSIMLPLPMLSNQTVLLYSDTKDRKTRRTEAKVNKNGFLNIVMEPEGGAVAVSF